MGLLATIMWVGCFAEPRKSLVHYNTSFRSKNRGVSITELDLLTSYAKQHSLLLRKKNFRPYQLNYFPAWPRIPNFISTEHAHGVLYLKFKCDFQCDSAI